MVGTQIDYTQHLFVLRVCTYKPEGKKNHQKRIFNLLLLLFLFLNCSIRLDITHLQRWETLYLFLFPFSFFIMFL